MAIAEETEEKNGAIVRILGEGDEDGNVVKEILGIALTLHESWLVAKNRRKMVEIRISII